MPVARKRNWWFPFPVESDSNSGQRAGNGGQYVSVAPANTIRHQRYRRNVLFLMTLFTLILVFIGAVPLGESLMAIPFAFALYWSICFILVSVVLMLALYDLMRVRRDRQKEAQAMARELAAAAADVRELLRKAEQEERGVDQG